MQTWNLERIPLPNFSTYVIYTIITLLGSFIYFVVNFSVDSVDFPTNSTIYFSFQSSNMITKFLTNYFEDSWCFWSLVNFCFCLLISVGRELQNVFFGQLRSAEDSHIRENFSTFIFYKVVFIYGILHVEALHELLLWATWFSILGFLRLLTGLTKDRFEFIMHCSYSSPIIQARMLLLCCALLLFSNFLMILSIIMGTKHSLHTMFFMLAEVFQLLIMIIHVITWYIIHLFCQPINKLNNGEKIYHLSILLYYTELIFNSVADLGDVIHNLHMLFWNKLQVNMSSIVIGMHLQHLHQKLSKRYHHHKRYQNVLRLLDTQFLHVQSTENCSICWEKMDSARQLPCGHLFHLDCLYLWIEQNTNCPICRKCLESFNETQTNIDNHSIQTKNSLSQSSTGCLDSINNSKETYYELNLSNSEQYSTTSFDLSYKNDKVNDNNNNDDNNRKSINEIQCKKKILNHSNLMNNKYEHTINESCFSAMASMNHLLDVHDQLIAENVADLRTLPPNNYGLSSKFLATLEAELMRFFGPSDDSSDSSKPEQLELASLNPVSESINLKHSPTDLFNSNVNQENLDQSSNILSNLTDSSHSEEDGEFPPKADLQLAIRNLLHRVSNTVNMSKRIRKVRARILKASSKCVLFEKSMNQSNLIAPTVNTETEENRENFKNEEKSKVDLHQKRTSSFSLGQKFNERFSDRIRTPPSTSHFRRISCSSTQNRFRCADEYFLNEFFETSNQREKALALRKKTLLKVAKNFYLRNQHMVSGVQNN